MELFSANGALLFGMVWSLFVLVSFYMIPLAARNYLKPTASLKTLIMLVAAVSLAARLIPNLFLPMGAGYDIGSYYIVGNLVLSGKDVYTAQEALKRHPYLPLQLYCSAFSLWLSQALNVSFVKVVRIAPILADIGIATLLTLLLYRRSPQLALQGGLLYALNPVPIFVSAYHGQFDAIPALFLLMAIGLITKFPALAGACLGLGILDKSWPVLGLPSLLIAIKGWKQRLCFLSVSLWVPAIGVGLYVLLFRGQVWTIVHRALSYNWGIGIWGYTYFFRLLSALNPSLGAPFIWLIKYGRYLTLAALGWIWWYKARKEPVEAGILTVLVGFFAVTHAFSIQYLMWVVPFAILNSEHLWLKRYTLGSFAYMLLAYTTLILDVRITKLLPWPQADWFIIMPAGLPAWLVTLGWVWKRVAEH